MPDLIDEHGRVKVKPTLQLASDDPALAHAYAIGDINNLAEMKTAYHTGLHAPIVAKVRPPAPSLISSSINQATLTCLDLS